MKEVEVLLSTLAEGLKSFARAVESVAEKVEEIAKDPDSDDHATRTKAKAAKGGKAKAKAKGAGGKAKAKGAGVKGRKAKPKKAAKRGKPAPRKSTTAADAVMAVIKKAGGTADTATIRAQTGFDAKKVQNVLYKLKKAKVIASPKKGVYQTTGN